MDERIRSIWVTRYPPRTIREYLTETGLETYFKERNKNDN